jgi:uncharacterized protein
MSTGSQSQASTANQAAGSGAKQVLGAFLQAMADRDIDGCLSLLGEHVRVLVPLAPEGVPRQLDGRAAFEPVLRTVHSLFASYRLVGLELYATDDPAVAIAVTSTAVKLADGRDYGNDNVFYARVQDGLISEYREYFDPIRAAAALAPS